VILIVMVSGLRAVAFERNQEGSNMTGLGDSLWWAVVTATTVGYVRRGCCVEMSHFVG
jgi:voltage-gated potassium channel